MVLNENVGGIWLSSLVPKVPDDYYEYGKEIRHKYTFRR